MTLAWVLPDEPTPIRLMNTIWADRHGAHDALTAPEHLAGWLVATRLAAGDEAVSDADLQRCRRLRDALRRLAASVTEDDRPAAASPTRNLSVAVADVNDAAAHGLTAPRIELSDGALRRIDGPAEPSVAAALSQVAAAAIDLLTGEAGAMLRACHAPGCVLYFLKDHPRREWCSTTCGNRARAARHYRRHRPHPSAPLGGESSGGGAVGGRAGDLGP